MLNPQEMGGRGGKPEDPRTADCGRAIDARIGERLKRVRLQAGKTQADVAKALGISAQQYQKYEKGATKCAITTLYALAAHYDRPLEDFLPGLGREQPGFLEGPAPFAAEAQPTDAPAARGPQTSEDDDDAAYMSQLLAIFIKIPDRQRRKRMLEILNELFRDEADAD